LLLLEVVGLFPPVNKLEDVFVGLVHARGSVLAEAGGAAALGVVDGAVGDVPVPGDQAVGGDVDVAEGFLPVPFLVVAPRVEVGPVAGALYPVVGGAGEGVGMAVVLGGGGRNALAGQAGISPLVVAGDVFLLPGREIGLFQHHVL